MDSVEPMQVDDPESGSAPPSDFTVDPPNFDLEGYANSYEGLAKVRRLMFVAKHCPSLQIDALRYRDVGRGLSFIVNIIDALPPSLPLSPPPPSPGVLLGRWN